MKTYKIQFEPFGNTIELPEGVSIRKAICEAGIQFDFPCGGRGTCGKCRVKVLEGKFFSSLKEKDFISEKEMERGIHLACYTEIHSDMVVELFGMEDIKYQILTAEDEKKLKVEPHINKKYIQVKKPSIGDHGSEWKRLKESLFSDEHAAASEIQISLLNSLPETLRKAKYQVTAVTYGDQILGIEEKDTTGQLIGMAFDIGTTTIVGFLIDLYTGRELSIVSAINPQAEYGADVISRISFIEKEEKGLEILHLAVIKTINKLIIEACTNAYVDKEDIYLLTVAGNTCMHHIFLGIDPRYISKAPYIPTICEPLVVDAKNLNILIRNTGKIMVLPNVAGFVGADTVAVILATDMEKSEDIKLMLDLGTNGELVLGSEEKLFTCSRAAGPAFEGAQISSGMRGAVGAIDHIKFEEDLSYTVIGQVKPQGICGSGLLDAIAGLVECGIVDEKGRIISSEKLTNGRGSTYKHRIIQHAGTLAFLIEEENNTSNGVPIMITQQDIRQFQLAKGAMAAGIKILMEKCGIGVTDIKEVLLAGAFGNYMNPHSACISGVLPRELDGKIKGIGNAAGTGAKVALLSANEFKRSGSIAEAVEFVELASNPKFSSIFARSMYFR